MAILTALFKDPYTGEVFDLTWPKAIDFQKLQFGETKKVEVLLRNTDIGRIVRSVVVDLIAHPITQLGTAEDTYESTTLSLDEGGPYSRPLAIGTMSPGEEIPIFIKWTVGQAPCQDTGSSR